jgi:CBS domain containing-hemolysin-like protein
VGTVSDELFAGTEEVQSIDERTYRVDAGMRVDEANEELALNLPESEDYETVAGFILMQLGHIPHEGEELRHESLKIGVTKMAGVKIETVTITKTEGGPVHKPHGQAGEG